MSTRMRERVHFQRRAWADDGWGNGGYTGEFETQFTEPARLKPGLGSETVIAARLTSIQPYTVTVRSSNRTRGVDTSWQIVDARDSTRQFNIKALSNPDERDRYMEFLVVEGAAS